MLLMLLLLLLITLFSFLGDIAGPPSLPFSLSFGDVNDSIECFESLREFADSAVSNGIFGFLVKKN